MDIPFVYGDPALAIINRFDSPTMHGSLQGLSAAIPLTGLPISSRDICDGVGRGVKLDLCAITPPNTVAFRYTDGTCAS